MRDRSETKAGHRLIPSAPATRSRLVFAALFVVLTIPLLVALGVLRSPRWYPLLDMAQTELRVRDVWSGHPPLIGLAGRIGPFGNQGSHPGPLSFWALWPFYQLFGASSWALGAAGAALNAIAIGASLWIARRRGGTTLMLAVGVVVAVLMHAYGLSVLTLPWNPYLPVLFWLAFLLAVWSVVSGDLPLLPVVVATGSFCMQTHVSYLGLVGGLVALTVAMVAYNGYRDRDDPERRRALGRWSLISVALVAVLWAPPVIDQLIHDRGNITVLWDHFSNPPEEPIGAGDGVRVFLGELNPWRLLTRSGAGEGQATGADASLVPGVMLLVVWLASAVVAWRYGQRALGRLNIVLGAAVVLGVVSTARIFGFVWYYLTLWTWSITALLVLAIVWTVAAVARDQTSAERRRKQSRFQRVALAAALVVLCPILVVDAAEVEIQSPRANAVVDGVVDSTATALDRRAREAPFLVTWLGDPLAIGAQGYALLNELERRGLDVRASDVHRAGATPYRVIEPREATLEVHLAIGATIDDWRAKPGFEEVAYYDPRNLRERAEFERERRMVIAGLEDAGLSEKIHEVDDNLFFLGLDDEVPRAIRDRIAHMQERGLPAAVFVGRPTGGA